MDCEKNEIVRRKLKKYIFNLKEITTVYTTHKKNIYKHNQMKIYENYLCSIDHEE